MKKNRISRLAAVLLAVVLMLTLAGCGSKGGDLPRPIQNTGVVDQADVLSDEAEAKVNQYSGALQSASGAQIGVLTVSDIGGEKLGKYAQNVFNAWGIGDAKKQNGVLLVLVTGNGGDYWCVQGKGLKKELSSETIGQLLSSYLEPSFAGGDFSGGVSAFVEALAQSVASAEGVTLDLAVQGSTTFHPEEHGGNASRQLLVLGGVFLVLCVVLVCAALLKKPAPSKGRRPAASHQSRSQSRPAAGRSGAPRGRSGSSAGQKNVYHAPSTARPRSSGSRPSSGTGRSSRGRS